jgi:hypothetical protein
MVDLAGIDSPVRQPSRSLPIRVTTLADLPGALGRLARLVAVVDHLDPKTAGRLAAEHARTLLTLADVMARRDTVPGATAPALLGAAGELLAHAATLVDVQAATRTWQSGAPDDVRPARQLREIRRQLGKERPRLRRALTDSDLRVVIASLRPALQLAPAMHHTVTRLLQAEAWKAKPPIRRGRSASPDVLIAARIASESAARMTGWLPTVLPSLIGGRRTEQEVPGPLLCPGQRRRTPATGRSEPYPADARPGR